MNICVPLCEHLFSFWDDKCLGIELLDHIVNLCLIFFKEITKLFSEEAIRTIRYSLQQCMRVPVFPQFHQYYLLSVFLTIAILLGIK